MASVQDSKAPFLQIPWAAALLNRPNTVCNVPGSRRQKASGEDSLFAELLKTPRTFRSCVCFYQKPSETEQKIQEVSTLIQLGDGMNGHVDIMHGGIVAAILDEGMGILENANLERDHLIKVGKGQAQGELPPNGLSSFTVELKVRYLKPVSTPGTLMVTARYTKSEGRKEWMYAEIKQHISHGEDDYGEEIVCATAEGLFVEPKGSKL